MRNMIEKVKHFVSLLFCIVLVWFRVKYTLQNIRKDQKLIGNVTVGKSGPIGHRTKSKEMLSADGSISLATFMIAALATTDVC